MYKIFLVYILLLHFEKKIRAREEVDRVLGARTEITCQDVNELKYCSSIFKESLRLFPPCVTKRNGILKNTEFYKDQPDPRQSHENLDKSSFHNHMNI